MPVSVPTLLALRFVKNNNLQNRINVLQKSYKGQLISFFSIGIIQMREYFVYHDLQYMLNHLFLYW